MTIRDFYVLQKLKKDRLRLVEVSMLKRLQN